MAIAVTDRIRRGEGGVSPFAVAWQDDLKIAFITVADITARDAIYEWKRLPYMTVYVIATNTEYTLGTDLTIAGQVWTEKSYGVPSNVVTEDEIFDSEGYIQPQLIKNIFLNTSYVVADEAAMLALTTYTGNFVIRSDTSEVYIKLNNDNPADISDFALASGGSGVISVNGSTGVVSVTIASLLAVGANQTAFDAAVTISPTVAANVGAILTIQGDITTLQGDLADLDDYVQTHLGIQALSSAAQTPTGAEVGQSLIWNGTNYDLSLISGSGFADPMTTRGDLIFRNSSNVTARLPVGTATYVLTSDGTNVSWAAPTGGSGGWPLTGTASLTGDVSIGGSASNYNIEIGANDGGNRSNYIDLRAGLGSTIDVGTVSIMQVTANSFSVALNDGVADTRAFYVGYDSVTSAYSGFNFYVATSSSAPVASDVRLSIIPEGISVGSDFASGYVQLIKSAGVYYLNFDDTSFGGGQAHITYNTIDASIGVLTITNSVAGTTGDLVITAGSDLLLNGGPFTGNVVIDAPGDIKLRTTSTAGHIWTASGTDGSGGWAAPSSSFTLTDGNGTTVNGADGVDWGGTLTTDVFIDGNYGFNLGNTTPLVSTSISVDNRIEFNVNNANGSGYLGFIAGSPGDAGFHMEIGDSDYQHIFDVSNTGALLEQIDQISADVSTLYLHNTYSLLSFNSKRLKFETSGTTLDLGSDATGDTYYRNSSGYFTRLPVGTNGHVLTLASGIPSWAALPFISTSGNWAMQGSGTTFTLGGGATASQLRFLEPSGSGANYTSFKAVAQSAYINYSLPPTVGAAGTVLTDVAGNGVLTWAAGGGITNGAANTELMMSNGTDAVSSKIFSGSSGNIQLGDATVGSGGSQNYVISAVSGATNTHIELTPSASGYVKVNAANIYTAYPTSGTEMYLSASFAPGIVHIKTTNNTLPLGIYGASGISGSTSGNDVSIFGGAGFASGTTNAGNVSIQSGVPNSGGTEGSVNIQSRSVGKLGFFNTMAIVQPTTGITAATFTANTSLIANDTATFDGYTIGQIVKALRNLGLLT